MADASTMPSQELIEREVDMLLARAGITVPAERRAAVVAAYAEQRSLAEIVRGPRPFSNEPANIYDIRTIIRSR